VKALQVPPQVGRRLRREREQRGWSLRQTAARSGVAAATVIRLERGHDGTLTSLIALTGVLGLSLDGLVAEVSCATCDGTPPAGFACGECGRGPLEAVP